MSYPRDKGLFIWQASSRYIPDPATDVERIKAHGFKWVAVQTVDGYITQWPETIQTLIRYLKTAGIRVWSWGMIYANGPNAKGWGYSEGVIAGHHVRRNSIEGHIFDVEAYSKRPNGSVGVLSAYDVYDSLTDFRPVGMTSYRYPMLHREIDWTVALDCMDFVAPQVYFERAHNPAYQLRRCVKEYRELTTVPIIPIAPAYGVRGWEPTVKDLEEFRRTVEELELQGYAFWNWDTLKRRPKLLSAVAEMF